MLNQILEDAINAEFGLVLTTNSLLSANILRRKLYAYRERFRQQQINKFDCLSFIPKQNGDLWIIRRDIKPIEPSLTIQQRPLLKDELPHRILARGKSRLSLPFLMDIANLGKKP